MSHIPNSELYTSIEAAKIFGVADRTIRLWIYRGFFPNAYRLDPTTRSVYRIPKEDIQAFLEKHPKKVSRPWGNTSG
jgi:excisionase family DNA binding protein